MNDREKWLAERRQGIGGSDMHHLMNEEPYGCARWLWYDKRGTEPDYDRDPDALKRMERGTKLEPLVAREYAERHRDVDVDLTCPMVGTNPWERVNPDRMLHTGRTDEHGVLECKTANSRQFRSFERDGLPAAYVLQLQWAMYVTGADRGVFAVLNPESWDYLDFEVPRNEQLIETLRMAAANFWRLHVNGVSEPERLREDDKRCESCEFRRICRGTEAPMQYPREDLITVPPEEDDSLAQLVDDYREAVSNREAWSATVETVADSIREAMGIRQHVRVPSARANVSFVQQKDTLTWDTAWLEKHHPELVPVAKTKVRKGARPLRITGEDNE